MKRSFSISVFTLVLSLAATNLSAQPTFTLGLDFGFGESALPGEAAPATPTSVVFGLSSATSPALSQETGRIFNGGSWTLGDIGSVRSVTFADDPDFSSIATRLGNGINDFVIFSYGRAKNSFATDGTPESTIFGGQTSSQVDLQGLPLGSISLQLDQLQIDATGASSDLGPGYFASGHVTVTFTTVPEPATMAFLTLSASSVLIVLRRRRLSGLRR